MPPKTQARGRKGESLALAYLQQQGYEIVGQNYRYRRAEIDIIARQGSTLVFVEVKYRTRADYGMPEEGVSENQKQQILSAAEQYIIEQNWQHFIRFDIVAILDQGQPEITHLEDAFYE